MAPRKSFVLLGVLAGLLLAASVSTAQVFPPRQTQPVQPPVPMPNQPGQMPGQPGMTPQFGGGPAPITKNIPLVAILGDPTKSFIQLGNMRSPFDSNFSLGRGLTGHIALEKYTSEAGNGQKSYVHISGVSNPPLMTVEGSEIRYQFTFPTIQFKTYYKDYSGEGDSALTDLVAERVLIDVFLSPTIDQRRLPTYHSVRIAITGGVKESDKCTHFFDIIFPVNVCKISADYFRQIQPALENGIREVLLQPQTRAQFEQQVFQFLRADLLAKAGINPMSPAQVEILQAEFRGTEYVVSYLPR
jgi:hypothetical protein